MLLVEPKPRKRISGVSSAANTLGRTERDILTKIFSVRIGEYVDFDFTAADHTRALTFRSHARAHRHTAAASAIVQTGGENDG